MKSIFALVLLSCGAIGGYFSAIGLKKFPDSRFLFTIALCGSLLAILIAIRDLLSSGKRLSSAFHSRLPIGILSGLVLVLAGIYVLLFTTYSLFIKLIVLCGVIFFGLAIVKGLLEFSQRSNRN